MATSASLDARHADAPVRLPLLWGASDAEGLVEHHQVGLSHGLLD